MILKWLSVTKKEIHLLFSDRQFSSKAFKYSFWLAIVLLLSLKVFLITNVNGNEEFLQTYKFVTDDGFDILANGVRLFQNDNISFYNPGLVLLVKVLYAFNVLYLIVFINHAVFAGTLIFIYKISKILTENNLVSYSVVFSMFVNYSLQHFNNYLLADYYAIFFILISVYLLFKNKYSLSIFFLGFSLLFKNYSIFILPAWCFYIYLKENEIENTKQFFNISMFVCYLKNNYKKVIRYTFLFLNFNILWFLYKWVKFGNPLYSGVKQFGLLSPNVNSLGYYFVNLLTLFGVCFFLSFIFISVKNKNLKYKTNILFLLSGIVITLVFWCIFYDWNDRRFLLFLIPFYFPMLSLSLNNVMKRLGNIKTLFLFAILIFPTTLSLGSFFNSYTIPVSCCDNIEFTTYNDKIQQEFITTPIEFKHDDCSKGRILSMINPVYAQSFWNSYYYRKSQDTRYMHYVEIIDDNYNETDKEICLKDVDFAFNILSKMLLIRKNESTRTVKVRTDC